MAKYTFKYFEIHEVVVEKTLTFDTENQKQWEEVKGCALSNGWEGDEDGLDLKAPSDPLVWYDLCQSIPDSELESTDHLYWQSLQNGEYKIAYELCDEDGIVIEYTSHE